MRTRLILTALFLVCLMSKAVWIPLAVRVIPTPSLKDISSTFLETEGVSLEPIRNVGFDNLTTEIEKRLTAASSIRLPSHTFMFVSHLDNIAGAAPDGTILVGANGFQLMQRPEELAGLITHELAHLIHHDHLRSRLWMITEAYTQWLLLSGTETAISIWQLFRTCFGGAARLIRGHSWILAMPIGLYTLQSFSNVPVLLIQNAAVGSRFPGRGGLRILWVGDVFVEFIPKWLISSLRVSLSDMSLGVLAPFVQHYSPSLLLLFFTRPLFKWLPVPY